ncbi:hypothetical protein WJX84_002437 [Apatococcus fuscideae]
MQPAVKKRRFAAPAVLQARAASSPLPSQNVAAEWAANTVPKDSRYYTVLYTKRAPNKKKINKSFADGVLEVKADATCILYGAEGQNVSRSRVKGTLDMPEGAELTLGNWELEVDARLDAATFM